MKRTYNYLITLLLLLGFSAATNAQSTMAWGWGKSIGGTNTESPRAIAADSRNGVYVFGHFSGSITADGQVLSSAGGSDMYLIKYDTTGNLQWAKRFGGTGNEEGKGLKTDRSGNLVLTGHFEGSVNFGGTTLTSTGASDVCVVKLRPDGSLVWAKQFTGSSIDKGGALICDDQRNIYTVGTFISNNFDIQGSSFSAPKTYNVFYCKLDSNGNRIWAKSASSNTPIDLYSFTLVQPNTLLMHGYSDGVSSNPDPINFNPQGTGGILAPIPSLFSVKINIDGAFIGQNKTSTDRYYKGGTTLTANKRIIKAGAYAPQPANDLFMSLSECDTNNINIQDKYYGNGGLAYCSLSDIITTKNGKLYAVGNSRFTNNINGYPLAFTEFEAFVMLEIDDSLTVRGLLTTNSNLNFRSSQILTNVAADSTANNVLFVGGMFATLPISPTFTIGNNVLPAYGAGDIFIGQVRLVPTPLRAFAGNDITYCTGTGVTIGVPTGATGGSAPYSYSWLPVTGLANPTSASTVATPPVNTTYILTVTDALGNTAKDTVVINVAQSPTAIPAITVMDSIICQGDSATLSTVPVGAYSHNWYNNAALVATTAAPTYKTITAGSYTLRFKDNGTGCLGLISQPVVVQVKPVPAAPTITSSGSSSACQGDSVVLTSNPQNNYLWSNGATTQSITVRSNGSYTVSTTSANGCKSPLSAAAVVVINGGQRPNLGADTLLYHRCFGETTNLPLLYNTGSFSTVWNTASPTVAPPGNYRLIAYSNPGCADTVLVNIRLEVAHWTGNVNSNWHTPGNWSINKVPTAFTHVIISVVSTGDSPVISAANAVVASLQLRNGATLSTANGMTVNIAGNCAVLPPN